MFKLNFKGKGQQSEKEKKYHKDKKDKKIIANIITIMIITVIVTLFIYSSNVFALSKYGSTRR